MEEPHAKMPRRAETSESVVPFHSSEASSSELQQTNTAGASHNPTGERLDLSMTEEGPSGDYKMTMQRDRHGRWMPTQGERTMNIQKAREVRRNYYVGGSQEHGTFSIASAEASTLHVEILFQSTERRRGILEPPFCRRTNAIETEWQGVLDFKAVTIIDSVQADVIREKHRERVISSRLVLRWKETYTGYKAKARWCVHGFKDPDIHKIERSCPTPELSSINITPQILASTTSEGTLADGEEAFMQGDASVRDEPLYATPPPEGLPGVPEEH